MHDHVVLHLAIQHAIDELTDIDIDDVFAELPQSSGPSVTDVYADWYDGLLTDDEAFAAAMLADPDADPDEVRKLFAD